MTCSTSLVHKNFSLHNQVSDLQYQYLLSLIIMYVFKALGNLSYVTLITVTIKLLFPLKVKMLL